jgi:hypothetical protein
LSKLTTSGTSENRYLADSTTTDITPTTGTAVSVRRGIALLEAAATSVGRVNIHAPRDVVSLISDDLVVVDDHLETVLGSIVSAGTGYTRTGPTGLDAAGTKRWIYVTGPVSVFLSEIDIYSSQPNETVDTNTNTTTVRAHQFAAPVFDGCDVYAVLVDLSL